MAAALPLVLLMTCSASVRLAHEEQAGESRARPQRTLVARPPIVSRSEWHAGRRPAHRRTPYTHVVRAAFVHHTGHPNSYDCADSPTLLRALQKAHVARGWDDVGYNFVVDRCGTLYEGRSGGPTLPVKGAHTSGFNSDTMGVAVLGTFDAGTKVPDKVLASLAALIAWKLSPGADPSGTTTLRSSNSESRFKKGREARLHTVSGHRDAYMTDCPGEALYDKLPRLRAQVARIRRAAEEHATERAAKAR